MTFNSHESSHMTSGAQLQYRRSTAGANGSKVLDESDATAKHDTVEAGYV